MTGSHNSPDYALRKEDALLEWIVTMERFSSRGELVKNPRQSESSVVSDLRSRVGGREIEGVLSNAK